MKGNFARINNMESENNSTQLSRICIENGFIFFCLEDYSKSAQGMILILLFVCCYTPALYKTAEKATVI